MALKEESITIDGIEFNIKERSFKQQLELEKIKEFTSEDIYKQCITPFDKLDEIGKDGTAKLLGVYRRVNGLDDNGDDATPSNEKGVVNKI